MSPHSDRIQSAQTNISTNTALLISDPLDIFYLTGFICLTPEEREAFLLLTSKKAFLLLSSFSTPPQVHNLQVHVGGLERYLRENLKAFCGENQLTSITLDGNSLRLSEYEFFKSILSNEVSLTSTKDSPLKTQKMVKDSYEIEATTKANTITHNALNTTFSQLKAGMTELDVQEMLENEMRKFGVTEFAFPTIVCFGNHSALPHHQPDDTKLTENMPILIDCGAKWQKYCADVTRTIWFGNQVDPEFANIENTVKEAYDQTFSALKNRKDSISAANLDKVARDHITSVGYGPQFIHTTGHGVGLYIHEQPSLNQNNPTQLKPDMIITIEPGIYLDGKFGYRFENSILITQNGAKELL